VYRLLSRFVRPRPGLHRLGILAEIICDRPRCPARTPCGLRQRAEGGRVIHVGCRRNRAMSTCRRYLSGPGDNHRPKSTSASASRSRIVPRWQQPSSYSPVSAQDMNSWDMFAADRAGVARHRDRFQPYPRECAQGRRRPCVVDAARSLATSTNRPFIRNSRRVIQARNGGRTSCANFPACDRGLSGRSL